MPGELSKDLPCSQGAEPGRPDEHVQKHRREEQKAISCSHPIKLSPFGVWLYIQEATRDRQRQHHIMSSELNHLWGMHRGSSRAWEGGPCPGPARALQEEGLGEWILPSGQTAREGRAGSQRLQGLTGDSLGSISGRSATLLKNFHVPLPGQRMQILCVSAGG